MTTDRLRSRNRRPVVAATCAVGVGLLWILLPAVEAIEPAVGDGLPTADQFSWWAVLVLLVAQSTALAWRLSHPVVVGVLVAAAVPAGAVVGMGSAIGLTSVAVLIAVYSLATVRPWAQIRFTMVALGGLVASGHVLAALMSDMPAGSALATAVAQAGVVIGAPAAVAVLVMTRRESRAAREDRVEALEREHDALVQAAVARERTAMARELHDIAAHHLTGISVMSAAIAAQIDTDPAGAKQAVGDVRRQSTAVLRDLRSLVGLLREHDVVAPANDVRVESLTGVTDLVAQATHAGQDVTLTTGAMIDQPELGQGIGPLAQLAVYRTVQESLANARRHAPGASCEVDIDDRDSAALVVTVRNAAPSMAPDPRARGGLGLVGMRERADLTGSHLDVGPTPDGGFQVRLRVPRASGEESA